MCCVTNGELYFSKACLIESLIVKAKFIFYRDDFSHEQLLSTAKYSNQLVSCFIPFYTIDTALKSWGLLFCEGRYISIFCLIFYLENSLSGK